MSLSYIREEFRARKSPLPYAIRYILRNSAATDPRDFIYGLLGLLDEVDRRRIKVDYDIHPMDLFAHVSWILWTDYRYETLEDLLPLLEFHPERDDYPSRVIDFAAQPRLGWRDFQTVVDDTERQAHSSTCNYY